MTGRRTSAQIGCLSPACGAYLYYLPARGPIPFSAIARFFLNVLPW